MGDSRGQALLKHRGTPGSLTDTSSDLWKTIRVWSTAVSNGGLQPDSVVFALITTAEAPIGSIASLLLPGPDRDPVTACERLRSISERSKNVELAPCFEAFLALSPDLQRSLVGSIRVIASSTRIEDVPRKVKKSLRLSVRPEHVGPLYARLEGWWFGRVVEHLKQPLGEAIRRFELRDRILTLAEQFRPNALPIDFADESPPGGVDSEKDDQLFVRQLRMISLGKERIEIAMLDYYRAFEQRSRWAREELLVGDELASYEARLVEEWRRQLLARRDRVCNTTDEEELLRLGRGLYNWADLKADIRIRPDVTHGYVRRGSFHLLANEHPPRVWWHPAFKERLADLWEEAVGDLI